MQTPDLSAFTKPTMTKEAAEVRYYGANATSLNLNDFNRLHHLNASLSVRS